LKQPGSSQLKKTELKGNLEKITFRSIWYLFLYVKRHPSQNQDPLVRGELRIRSYVQEELLLPCTAAADSVLSDQTHGHGTHICREGIRLLWTDRQTSFRGPGYLTCLWSALYSASRLRRRERGLLCLTKEGCKNPGTNVLF